MKPWEETWVPDGDGVVVCPEYHDGTVVDRVDRWDALFGGEGTPELRARLAAAAPEMARMLLYIEQHGVGYEGDCIGCDLGAGRHLDYCTLVAVLRKAGVLP